MQLPELKNLTLGRDMTTTFGGINRTETCGDGEWREAMNLSSDEYPCTTSRAKRFSVANVPNMQGMIYNNGWVYVANDRVKMKIGDDDWVFLLNDNGDEITLPGGGLTDNLQRKQLVNMGAYVYIFPNGYYINTSKIEVITVDNEDRMRFGEYGQIKIENETDAEQHPVTFLPVDGGYADWIRSKDDTPVAIDGHATLTHSNSAQEATNHITVDESLSNATFLTKQPRVKIKTAAGYKVYFVSETVDAGQGNSDYLVINEDIIPAPNTTISVLPHEKYTYGNTEPKAPYTGDFWISGSSDGGAVAKMWSGKEWKSIAFNYMLITGTGIAEGLSAGDSVKLWSDVGEAMEQGTVDVKDEDLRRVLKRTHNNYLNIKDIWTDKNQLDNILVSFPDGGYATALTYGELKLTRECPALDYVIESGNRLWGCRYGPDGNEGNELLNEIYASKMGDGKNWRVYTTPSLADDSYTVSVGDAGAFTGAINYQGYPYFFKENCVYKIYGSYPANYQLTRIEIDGVARGCGRSLAEVGGYMYYVSHRGVLRFDGISEPVPVSEKLGDVKLNEYKLMLVDVVPAEGHDPTDEITPRDEMQGAFADWVVLGACAGTYKDKYYLSLPDGDLFVYDTRKGIWHRENAVNAMSFASHSEELYYVIGKTEARELSLTYFVPTLPPSTRTITFTLHFRVGVGVGAIAYSPAKHTAVPETGLVRWYGETGIINTDDPDRVYVSRVNLRMTMNAGSRCMVYIQYDSIGNWRHVGTLTGTSLRSYSLPVRVRRCDHFRLRIAGEGYIKLYGITRTTEEGSDRVIVR